MTPPAAVAALMFGLVCVVAGLAWALGPWALVGSGLLIAAVALLVPVRERRGEPVEEAVLPE